MLLAASARGEDAASPAAPRYGEAVVRQFRVGVRVTASRGPCRDIRAMVAVPLEWPEQEVEIVEEEISPQVESAETRMLGEGAKQMVVVIPDLAGGEEAEVILTFEVRTKSVLPPEDTSLLLIPERPSRDLKAYLGRSPMIETKNSKIRRAVREALAEAPEDEGAWERVERIYDYVQDKITYVEGDDKSAVATLKEEKGDCHNISALLVAMWRTAGVPARMVWVNEHQYPEFCLVDAEDNPYWFPCESSGQRAFGEMPLPRIILQKGDNFRVPERKETLRYASDYLLGKPAPGGGKPKTVFIREAL